MKVVCVDDGPNKNVFERRIEPRGRVALGEVYTVLRVEDASDGKIYILSEKPLVVEWDGRLWDWGWAIERFVPADYYAAEFAVKETETQPSTQKVCTPS